MHAELVPVAALYDVELHIIRGSLQHRPVSSAMSSHDGHLSTTTSSSLQIRSAHLAVSAAAGTAY
jgi:hypothetical protein